MKKLNLNQTDIQELTPIEAKKIYGGLAPLFVAGGMGVGSVLFTGTLAYHCGDSSCLNPKTNGASNLFSSVVNSMEEQERAPFSR